MSEDLKDIAAMWLEEMNISGDTMIPMDHNLEDIPILQRGSYNLFDLLTFFVDHIQEGEDLKKANSECTCNFCTANDLYRWATITECPCACHNSKGIAGHEGLCCEFPNGKVKDNPHKDLKPAIDYRKILNEYLKEG